MSVTMAMSSDTRINNKLGSFLTHIYITKYLFKCIFIRRHFLAYWMNTHNSKGEFCCAVAFSNTCIYKAESLASWSRISWVSQYTQECFAVIPHTWFHTQTDIESLRGANKALWRNLLIQALRKLRCRCSLHYRLSASCWVMPAMPWLRPNFEQINAIKVFLAPWWRRHVMLCSRVGLGSTEQEVLHWLSDRAFSHIASRKRCTRTCTPLFILLSGLAGLCTFIFHLGSATGVY